MSDENMMNYDNNQNPQDQSNAFGIASMVCGILSIVTCCFWYIGVILAIVSIVLGILQIRKNQKKGMAIAGIVCSIVTIVLVIITLVLNNVLYSSGFYQEYLRALREAGLDI